MGKKSKRSPYEVQSATPIDHFGNKLNVAETDNAPEKKKKDLKSTKQKSPERIEKKESNRDHNSQIPSVDHFGKEISEPKNSRKTETRDSKPSQKVGQSVDNGETSSTEKNLKARSPDLDEEYSSEKSHKRKSTEEFLEKEESDRGSYDSDRYKYTYEKHKGKDYKSKNNRQNPILLRIKEVKGNLFDAPDTSSLAHCVAEDLQMGAGIAVEFKDRFRKTGYLASLGVKTGGVAVLEDKNRFIYYMITKKLSKSKPTMTTLKNSLMKMAEHVKEHNVKELAMPMIGCGLDRLDWGEVSEAINQTFCYIDVEITIYQYDGSSNTDVTQKKTGPHVKHINSELGREPGTALLYLSNTDGYETIEMKLIERQRPFLREFKNMRKNMGNIVKIVSKTVNECVYGLVCKDNNKILFPELENCLAALKPILRTDEYENIGIQGFVSDNLDMHHIITLLKHYIPYYVTIWVYWKDEIPEDFQSSYSKY